LSSDAENRYEKLASIGSGGIGTVYRARQVALNREVALKEIRDLFGFFSEDQRNEIVRRFTDVVRAWGNLAHPNILPIHDVNLYSEFPNLVTELAPNGSCRRLINDAEEIPVELVFKYLLQTLHALRAAHAQRVYHRGLKPEQLLIDGYGNVKVSDFGFTRIVERDHAVIRQIYVGMGNVAYMAPELYTDPMMAGPQGDIYALGIIFYELLTRKLPGRRSPMPSELNKSLPKGIVRVYKADASGAQQFIGEDHIDHTPRDEKIRVKMGDAFDIVGDRVQMLWTPLGTCGSESDWEVNLRNHKDTPVEVEVFEPIGGDWEVVKSSLPHNKKDAHTFTFDAKIAARSNLKITYRVRTKWC
jgi:serine/threonine protein kinase